MFYVIFISLYLALPVIVFGQVTYSPLIEGGGLETDSIGAYINSLYLISISIAALLATIKLIIAGAKYMLSDVVTTQGEAKKEIQSSLLGLLLVISAVLILTIINPDLVSNQLTIQRVQPAAAIPPAANLAGGNQGTPPSVVAGINRGCGGRATQTDTTDPQYEIIVVDYTQCPTQNLGSASPLKRECDTKGGVFTNENNKIACRYRKQTTPNPNLPTFGTEVSRSREFTVKCAEEFRGDPAGFSNCVPSTKAACEPAPFFGTIRITNGSDVTCSLPDVIEYPGNDFGFRLDCTGQRNGTYRPSGTKAYCTGCLGLTAQCSYTP